MTIKQGDLAMIRGSELHPENNGSFVTVMGPAGFSHLGSPVWFHTPAKGGHVLARECVLFPIRDPGDDATDETLTWLPVPHKEHA